MFHAGRQVYGLAHGVHHMHRFWQVLAEDLYAMNLPLFLPDLAGLHRVAVTYFARFRMLLAKIRCQRCVLRKF